MKITRRANSQRLDTFSASEPGSEVVVTSHRNRVIVRVERVASRAHFECELWELAEILIAGRAALEAQP